MNIYPYVYRLDHPETGEFYIGYRCANRVPAEYDLGFRYFTSSNKIKHRFNEFNITIIAECFDKNFAYDLEQLLIFENWENPNILNKHCTHGKGRYRKIGPHSEESKQKMRKPKRPLSAEEKQHLSILNKGKKLSSEIKNKISESRKQKSISPWNKNLTKTDNEKLKDLGQKVSEKSKGVKKSESHCSNISKGKTGKKRKPFSEEHKRKIGEAVKRRAASKTP